MHTGEPLGGADATLTELVLRRTLDFLGVTDAVKKRSLEHALKASSAMAAAAAAAPVVSSYVNSTRDTRSAAQPRSAQPSLPKSSQAKSSHATSRHTTPRQADPSSPRASKQVLAKETHDQLAAFFRPANAALARLLQERCRGVPLEPAQETRGPVPSEVEGRLPGGFLKLPAAMVAAGRGQWLVEGSSRPFRRAFIA
mgnify:CR=1 FL=1